MLVIENKEDLSMELKGQSKWSYNCQEEENQYKREILPDPRYKDMVLAKFVRALMVDGKKNTAEKLIYSSFDRILDEKERKVTTRNFSKLQ